jgi:hypothetical protein
MPKNKVTDPITDQEIAFARLVLSGVMTDRRAAEAVGLDPDSAAYTKAKPRVRDYMLEHPTRISCLATPDTATCAAFIKESRMESANANQPNRKSGGIAVQRQPSKRGWPIQAGFWLEWGTFPAPRCTPLKQSLNGPPSNRMSPCSLLFQT